MSTDIAHLSFNYGVIAEDFTPLPPTSDDGAPGPFLLLRGGELVVRREGPSLALPEGGPVSIPGTEPLLIGLWRGKPLRTARLPQEAELPEGCIAEPFNAVSDVLDDVLLTLGGVAHQILYWEKTSRSCPVCGGDTERVPGTWGKRCLSCGHERYPHIHPCIIVLVRRGEEFLLGRKREWPAGRYSLIAGFLDFGESLEECVRREVREEAGVEVANIRYVGSQSWPFPSQLMAAFVADYAGGEIDVSGDELEDARWFCASLLPDSLPGRRSIARWIIDTYALRRKP